MHPDPGLTGKYIPAWRRLNHQKPTRVAPEVPLPAPTSSTSAIRADHAVPEAYPLGDISQEVILGTGIAAPSFSPQCQDVPDAISPALSFFDTESLGTLNIEKPDESGQLLSDDEVFEEAPDQLEDEWIYSMGPLPTDSDSQSDSERELASDEENEAKNADPVSSTGTTRLLHNNPHSSVASVASNANI
ncbi:hypothetical protein K439DRAFT_1620945 [Ramaria rubella]|nr:hypothetical protein K439DRAFT_1620945 [Ramaria rubella]